MREHELVSSFEHDYPFDPSYGYTLERLLQVGCPEPVEDFEAFWRDRYAWVRRLKTYPRLNEREGGGEHWRLFELSYRSTDDFEIRGWVLAPRHGEVCRGFVHLHGYGGAEGPDWRLPFRDAVIFFPCLRGLALSRRKPVSSEPDWHVLHDIDKPDRYIHGGCVEDCWLAVSALLECYPETAGRLGLMGISFGGGIGALALPWDDRLLRAHLEVPSFGHHPLRLGLPTVGSGSAVIEFEQKHGGVLRTLQYYDAAVAARFVRVPVQVAAACFDPSVAPPGQFAIYNALPGEKELVVLSAGHFEYAQQAEEEQNVLQAVDRFFAQM